MENDFYTEYVNDKLIKTNDPKDVIGRETLYKNFRDWYRETYDSKTTPKKIEFEKFMCKCVGEFVKGKGFVGVTFSRPDEETAVEEDNP